MGLLNSDSKPQNTNNNNNNNNKESSDKSSASLIYFVKNMEGYSPSVYNDAVNVKTLGYGLTGKEIEGLNNISEETATKLLTKYINDNYFSKVLSIIKSKGDMKYIVSLFFKVTYFFCLKYFIWWVYSCS